MAFMEAPGGDGEFTVYVKYKPAIVVSILRAPTASNAEPNRVSNM